MLKIAALSAALMMQSWAYVTTDQSGARWEVDMSSRTRIYLGQAAWVRMLEPDNSVTMVNHVFDCAERSAGVRKIIRYTAQGKVIEQFNYPDPLVQMQPVPPGTIIETTLLAVCAR